MTLRVLAMLCLFAPLSLHASDLIPPDSYAESSVAPAFPLDSFDPYATVAPSPSFADLAMPVYEASLPLHTRYGVIAPDLLAPLAPPSIVRRAGAHGILGSHTQGLEAELGLVFTHVARECVAGTFTADLSETLGLFGRQWSYEFAGLQSKSSAEFVWKFAQPVSCLGGIGIGWRLDWYFNRSFEEIRGGPVSPEDEHEHLDQRLGTIIFHHDKLSFDGFRRFRLEFENDVTGTGGDGGDQFRTSQIRLLWLRQACAWQRRCGVSLAFFTGETSDKTVNIDGQEFYDMTGLAFADRSQGLLEFEFGLSYFHRHGCHLGEIGFDVELGPDTEGIRDTIQNRFVHKRITDTPFVPKVDRSGRFKSDLSVFYIVHY